MIQLMRKSQPTSIEYDSAKCLVSKYFRVNTLESKNDMIKSMSKWKHSENLISTSTMQTDQLQ